MDRVIVGVRPRLPGHVGLTLVAVGASLLAFREHLAEKSVMPGKPKPIQRRPVGRPRLAQPNVRLETMIPQAALAELKRREAASGKYRTRIAASILERELIGGEVNTYYAPTPSQ